MTCCAQQFVFSSIDTSDGLSDNFVLHILQLHDGRIAATTLHHIDLWDGHTFQSIQKEKESSQLLKGYRGAYHVYADKDNRLWVKDYKKLWCYDAHLHPIADCLPDSADDVYVDDRGEVFFVRQDTTNLLLDLQTLRDKQYRFYANGDVVCYDGKKKLYTVQAHLDSTAITSLVIADTLRQRFYQLIDQKLCLEFDTKTRRWTEIFRANQLHTIAQTDAHTAYIVSRDGMWRIDLDSRKAETIEQVMMADGSYISSSRLNTIYTDRDGTVWLGSYDHGMLKGVRNNGQLAVDNGPLTVEEKQHPISMEQLWGILTGIACGILFVFLGYLWHRRKKTHLEKTEKEEAQAPVATPTTPIDHELINRATTFVEQNLTTPNYTVERLAQDLCMDRTGLYKKMTSMLGKTPTAFIRSIRVQHAVKLIQTGTLTMTEVAEQSGFSSASYMAKCFQEDLGKNPSELRENQP